MARRQWLADEDLDRMQERWQFLIDLTDPVVVLRRVEAEMQRRNKGNPLATPGTISRILKLPLDAVERIITTCAMFGKHMRGKRFFPLRSFAVVLCDVWFISLDLKHREELRRVMVNNQESKGEMS